MLREISGPKTSNQFGHSICHHCYHSSIGKYNEFEREQSEARNLVSYDIIGPHIAQDITPHNDHEAGMHEHPSASSPSGAKLI